MNSVHGWIVGALLSCCADPTVAALSAGHIDVHWPKTVEILQGGLAEVRIGGTTLTAVEGRVGQTPIHFQQSGASFTGLVGADIEAKPGVSKLLLLATSQRGTVYERKVPIYIKAKAFRTESFTVPPNFDQVSPETAAEISREQADFARAFAFSSAERLWEAPFVRPVPQEASASSFGSRRIINGSPRAPHSGTDLSAPLGTEVVASNYGRVVLIGNYFFAGGSVVLDHGGGLFTMYFHLSEFKVEQGSLVKRGDILGLSGASGRVTGPHLHWGARLSGARINPLELLKVLS
ncbi:MAG TPA: M23 family metallopeptidase [Candidatus Binatia bacterium]